MAVLSLAEIGDEENVSTEQSAGEAPARLPGSHADPGRARCDQGEACARPGSALRLSGKAAVPSSIRAVPPADPPAAHCAVPHGGPATARFPRSARLLQRREYQRIFAGALRSGDSGFTVLAAPNSDGAARLGLAISKRETRAAVRRNRIKRRIRESFRRRREQLAGLDIVVMAKRGVDSWSSAAIDASLAHHWSNVKRKCAG